MSRMLCSISIGCLSLLFVHTHALGYGVSGKAQPQDPAALPAKPDHSPMPGSGPGAAAAHSEEKPIFPAEFRPAVTASRSSQSEVSAGDGWASVKSMAVPLLVVLLVIGGAAWLLRRAVQSGGSLASALGAGGRAPAGLIEVLGRYPVARGQTLVLLKLDQRVLLLSQVVGSRSNPGGFSTLSEITDAEDVASILSKVSESESTGPASRFNAILTDADRGHEASGPGPLRRIANMVNPQPVSWEEPQRPESEPPVEIPYAGVTASSKVQSGVDSLRVRIERLKQASSGRVAS